MDATETMEWTDPNKKPPDNRVADGDLWNVWKDLREADEKRAEKRSRVQGAVDGNSPWQETDLKKAGQLDRTNVNFHELGTVVQDWEDAYYDLALVVPRYFNLTPAVMLGEDQIRARCIIEEELDRTLRGWFGWISHHLVQINQLVVHGYGHFYFPHNRSWQFRPLKVNQVLIPDDFEDVLDNLPICGIGPFQMTMMDLYALIRTPEAKAYSKKAGWDIDAVKEAITVYANTGVAEKDQTTFEDIQAMLQRGNIACTDNGLNKGCQICHLLVREYNGKVTKYMIDEQGRVKKALFKKEDAAEKITDLVSFFFFRGSKTNYHEVRGIGRDGYNAGVVLNRLSCRMVDEGEDAMTPTYKATGGGGDGRDAVRRKGRVNLIPSGWEPMPEKSQGSFQAGAAATRAIRNLMASSTKSPSLLQSVMRDSTQPRTAAEIQASANMGQDIRVTLSQLYYTYRDFFLRNLYRRLLGPKLTEYEPGYAEQDELFARLMFKGVTAEMWNPGLWDIRASRAVGSGSAGSRRNALEGLGQIYSRMDVKGQKNWDKEWAAVMTGDYSLASVFVPPENRDELPSADRSYAELENAVLMSGQFPIQASPDQPARIHLMVHMQVAEQIAQQFQQSGNPQQYPGLEALLVHSAQHVDAMAQDQTMQQEAEQWKERLAAFVDLMKEMGRQLQAAQEAQQRRQQSQMQQQVEIEAARRSGAVESELAAKLEKVAADKEVKMRKAEDARELKERKQESDFTLAMKKLDQDLQIKREEARAKKQRTD